jgi:hypothetical protein
MLILRAVGFWILVVKEVAGTEETKSILTEPVKKGMNPVIYGHRLVREPLHLAIDVRCKTRVEDIHRGTADVQRSFLF